MQNKYMPEGHLVNSIENKDLISSLSGLENAMINHKILEAPAILCDASMALHVKLGGGIRGYIEKSEAVLCRENEEIKDIAIITRVGKNVCFHVKGFRSEAGETVAILSRKSAQEECFASYLSKLSPGDIIPARVTHLESFGAFVDIGCGISSLLSIDCLSVSRIPHPKERLYCGQDIFTVVKSHDFQSGRIFVSMRELLGTWQQNADLFEIGQTVTGIVRSIEEYGIFVELTPNLAGLAELHPDSMISPAIGHRAAVFIKNIIPEKMKIKLVLIDSQADNIAPPAPFYYITPDVTRHMDKWLYSPSCASRRVESCF